MNWLTKVALISGVVLIALPALAEQSPPPNNTNSGYEQSSGRHRHHDHSNRLTPEQHIMMKMYLREQARNIPRDQRKAYIKKAKADFRALPPQQRQQRLSQLEDRWNAMPADKRDQLMQKFKEKQARKAARRHGDKGSPQVHPAKHDRDDSDDDDSDDQQ